MKLSMVSGVLSKAVEACHILSTLTIFVKIRLVTSHQH